MAKKKEETEYEGYTWDELHEDEVEPEVVEERGTEKPVTNDVDFKVLRTFTWNGERLEPGSYTWSEDKYNQMAYDVNLRTDRIKFFQPL